jgi:hypothetical protein
LAVLGVVIYHCHPRLEGTPFYRASLWGWAGVNLFFVLSGFLITSILLEARGKPRYFRNFYARRALRIWPVYVLVLVVCYLNAPWFVGLPVFEAISTAPWWVYILFLQNLFHLALPPSIGPTWSLAIEEQYYFLWAPVVRLLARPWALAVFLGGALIASPLFRMGHFGWITPTHSLTHLDGIAMGSLLAIGLHTLRLSRRAWLAGGRHDCGRHGPPRLGAHGGIRRRGAGFDRRNRRAESAERSAAPRSPRLLRPHQLRNVHDAHHGIHLLRLVRPQDGRARHGEQPRGSGVPAGSFDHCRYSPLVWIRVAHSQAEAAVCVMSCNPAGWTL